MLVTDWTGMVSSYGISWVTVFFPSLMERRNVPYVQDDLKTSGSPNCSCIPGCNLMGRNSTVQLFSLIIPKINILHFSGETGAHFVLENPMLVLAVLSWAVRLLTSLCWFSSTIAWSEIREAAHLGHVVGGLSHPHTDWGNVSTAWNVEITFLDAVN